MKKQHQELLRILHKYADYIDEGYKNKYLEYVPEELLEYKIFLKIDKNHYRLYNAYKEFVNHALSRTYFTYSGGNKLKNKLNELKKLVSQYKEKRYLESKEKHLSNIEEVVYEIVLEMNEKENLFTNFIDQQLYQNHNINLDILINKAEELYKEIHDTLTINEEIYNYCKNLIDDEDFENIEGLNYVLKMVIFIIDRLSSEHIPRTENFIKQTKRERNFNKKVIKTINAIVNEEVEIDNFLKEYLKFPYKEKIVYYIEEERINSKKIKEIIGEYKLKRKEKQIIIDDNEDIDKVLNYEDKLRLKINISKIETYIKEIKSQDIFSDIYNYLLEKYGFEKDFAENESFKIFVEILNKYDEKNLKYTDNFNKFKIRIVKWIETDS